MGMEGEKTWRAAAQVRVLLMQSDLPAASIDSEEFWQDADVRWLAGVNEASGILYMNKEQFEELLCWVQLPALLEIAGQDSIDSRSISKIETTVSKSCRAARDAGYRLEQYLNLSKRAPSE